MFVLVSGLILMSMNSIIVLINCLNIFFPFLPDNPVCLQKPLPWTAFCSFLESLWTIFFLNCLCHWTFEYHFFLTYRTFSWTCVFHLDHLSPQGWAIASSWVCFVGVSCQSGSNPAVRRWHWTPSSSTKSRVGERESIREGGGEVGCGTNSLCWRSTQGMSLCTSERYKK